MLFRVHIFLLASGKNIAQMFGLYERVIARIVLPTPAICAGCVPLDATTVDQVGKKQYLAYKKKHRQNFEFTVRLLHENIKRIFG